MTGLLVEALAWALWAVGCLFMLLGFGAAIWFGVRA